MLSLPTTMISSLLLSLGVICVLLVSSAAASSPMTIKPPQFALATNSCEICEIVVALVETVEHSYNASLQEVIAIVNNLCLLIGGGIIGAECEFLTSVINEIIQWVAEELTPADICQRLNLCNGTSPVEDARAHFLIKQLKPLAAILYQKVHNGQPADSQQN